MVLFVAALAAFGALAAVLPRECGIADGPLEAFFLKYPRTGFFVAIGLTLAFLLSVAHATGGRLRSLAPSRLIPLALVSWASFELLHYLDSVPGPRTFEYREAALWTVLFLVAAVSIGIRGRTLAREAVELP